MAGVSGSGGSVCRHVNVDEARRAVGDDEGERTLLFLTDTHTHTHLLSHMMQVGAAPAQMEAVLGGEHRRSD